MKESKIYLDLVYNYTSYTGDSCNKYILFDISEGNLLSFLINHENAQLAYKDACKEAVEIYKITRGSQYWFHYCKMELCNAKDVESIKIYDLEHKYFSDKTKENIIKLLPDYELLTLFS
jgi:hypothetical protein